MTPRGGNTILFRSSQLFPCLRLGPCKRAFWALQGPSTQLVPCLRNYREARTLSTTADANTAFVENAFFFIPTLDCKKSTEHKWVSGQTWATNRTNTRWSETASLLISDTPATWDGSTGQYQHRYVSRLLTFEILSCQKYLSTRGRVSVNAQYF